MDDRWTGSPGTRAALDAFGLASHEDVNDILRQLHDCGDQLDCCIGELVTTTDENRALRVNIDGLSGALYGYPSPALESDRVFHSSPFRPRRSFPPTSFESPIVISSSSDDDNCYEDITTSDETLELLSLSWAKDRNINQSQ